MRTAVVVPTNRPERIQAFCEAWEPQLNRDDVRLIVVEDAPLPMADLPDWVEHASWENLALLGSAAECIPTRSGSIRDYGFWLAGRDREVGVIVSLDDDVTPTNDSFLAEHHETLSLTRSLRWASSVPGYRVRGLPWADSQVRSMLNHGLWTNVPDVDAVTQLTTADTMMGAFAHHIGQEYGARSIYPGVYFPLCSMNVAMRREVVPFMWQPVLPDGMKRWDDMWAGVIFKHTADLHGWAVTSGPPFVYHSRASNPLANLRQEMLGYGIHEMLWQVVDRVAKHATPKATWLACWWAVGRAFPPLERTAHLAEVWAGLWETGE